MHKTNSQQLYDQFAPHYEGYTRERVAYITAVDILVVEHATATTTVPSVVDVGSADGMRIASLAPQLHASRVVLIDDSAKMCALAKMNTPFQVWQADVAASTYVDRGERFTVVLCLWNVLGHVVEKKRRNAAFAHLAQLCNDNGYVYLDVNNRFNLAQYGWRIFLRNVWSELVSPRIREGSVACKIAVSSELVLDSRCHFYAPWEVRKLARAAGLQVERLYYIDYRTGQRRRLFWQGQIFVVLRQAAA